MRTRHNMFYIAATISLAIMLTISPIVLGKAYSVEYTGQTFNTGNDVQSDYIIIKLWESDGNGRYTEVNTEIFAAPELSSNFRENSTDTVWYLNETCYIIRENPEIFVSIESPSELNNDKSYELSLVPHIYGDIIDENNLKDCVTPSVIIEKPMYNDKGELESYSQVDTISIGEKYRIRANIKFNMLPIREGVGSISARFTLHSEITTVAEYTENTKTLDVKEPTVISPEIIIVDKIKKTIGKGFTASFDEESGKIRIHATDDYGMTPGNYPQNFETSFTIDGGMSFYLHIFLKKGTIDVSLSGGTNITVTCKIGDKVYSSPISDNTGNAGIYLGPKEDGSMTKIDTINGNGCFTANQNEIIEVDITGGEAGLTTSILDIFQLEKGNIEFSIVPWPPTIT